MVAEPGLDQGPVMRVDSQPSLPKQDATLSQDAASLCGDENSRPSFPTPWLDAVNKSKACSSSSGTTQGRTMPPTSVKGKAQSRPCKARDGATRHKMRRASGRGRPTARSRAWNLQHSASGDKALGIPNDVDGSRKSEGPHFISGDAKFSEHHDGDIDKSPVHSAAGAVQKAIRRVSAGLKDLSAGVGTLLEAGGDLSQQLNLVQRRLAKIEQQLVQPEVRLNAESQEFQPQATPEVKLELTPEAKTGAALQISRDEDYKVCASAVDGGVRSDITTASEHGGATVAPLTVPVPVRVVEVKSIPEVRAEMRQRLPQARVEEQQKKHKAEVLRQSKDLEARQISSDVKKLAEVKSQDGRQISSDENPAETVTKLELQTKGERSEMAPHIMATPVATVPHLWRALAQDRCDVADCGGATDAPSTETVKPGVAEAVKPVVEVVKPIAEVKPVAEVKSVAVGERLSPVAKDKSVAKVKPVDSVGTTVTDYGGATDAPSTATVKPIVEVVKPVVEVVKSVVKVVKPIAEVKPVVEVVKPVAEVKPVAVGERLLKKQGWKEGEGLGAKAQGLRTPPDFGQTRTPCDRAGLGSETRHGTRRGKTVISRNSDINFVRELPGRKEYSLKVCQHFQSRHPCGKDYLRGTYRIPVARELGDTLTQSLAEVRTFSLAQRGRDVEALLHSVQTTMKPQVATTLIGEVMFSLTHHSAYADTSNGPNDLPSGIAELIYPTSGTVQTLMEDVLPYIRSAGNSFYLPLFKCTRDVETGQFPDWYLRYLPRFYVNECNGEISIDPSRYGGVDKYQVRLNTEKRDNFDYDLRTDPSFASAIIHTLLQRCDWHVLARSINKFRHAALYYQLEFALDCVKRDVSIPDDWLLY